MRTSSCEARPTRGHGSGSGCRRGTAPAEPAHLWSRRRALPPLRPVRAARWRRQASGGLGRTALLPLPLLLGRRPEHLCLLRHLWRRCSLIARATSALAASLAAALACCCHDWPAGFALAAAGLATALAAAAPSATACASRQRFPPALPASAFASFSNLALAAAASTTPHCGPHCGLGGCAMAHSMNPSLESWPSASLRLAPASVALATCSAASSAVAKS